MSVLSWNRVLLSSLCPSESWIWCGEVGGREKGREGRKGPQGAGPDPCLHSECLGCLTWLLERGVPASELSHLLWAQEVVPCSAHSTSERPPFQTPSFIFPIQSLPAVRPPSLWVSSSSSGEAGGWQEGPPGLAIPGVWDLGHLGERQGYGKGHEPELAVTALKLPGTEETKVCSWRVQPGPKGQWGVGKSGAACY